jgi:hypothetical protein
MNPLKLRVNSCILKGTYFTIMGCSRLSSILHFIPHTQQDAYPFLALYLSVFLFRDVYLSTWKTNWCIGILILFRLYFPLRFYICVSHFVLMLWNVFILL